MVRTSILVSGGGVNLQSILDDYYFGLLPELEITGVISSAPDAYALTRAEASHVPAYTVDRSIFPNHASFCNALLTKLRDLDTELVVTAGFREKLNYPILHHYKNRVIAVQPFLFPAFCTGEPVEGEWAVGETLRLGLRVTGATAYFMTEEDIGYGPVIAQKAVEVQRNDTPRSLQDRIMRQAEWEVLKNAVALFCAGRLSVEGDRVEIAESGPAK